MIDLSGHSALVSGTSPNIGTGIAMGLAEAGAQVVCLDRSRDNAEDCARYLAAKGHRASAVVCDVTDADAVGSSIEDATERSGGIDILVNAAAFENEKGLLAMSLQEWRSQLDVILTGSFLLTRTIAKDLIARGRDGSIINVASTAGHQGQPGNIAYSTAKSGLLNFTRAAAMDLARYRIRVNSVTPTSTDPRPSHAVARAWGRPGPYPEELDERAQGRQGRIPLRRLPVPSDYAAAVVFLASQHARMITATDLRVDGGVLGKYWAWEPGDE